MNENLKFEREYSAPVEAVWEALTRARALGDWLMAGTFSPTEGSEFALSEPGLKVTGIVLKVTPHQELVYSWISRRDQEDGEAGTASVVSWTLAPTPSKGTLVTLEHRFVAEKPVVTIEASVNWSYALNSTLARHLRKYAQPVPIVYVKEVEQPSPKALPRAGFRQPKEVATC